MHFNIGAYLGATLIFIPKISQQMLTRRDLIGCM
jgi:hypothetical protein